MAVLAVKDAAIGECVLQNDDPAITPPAQRITIRDAPIGRGTHRLALRLAGQVRPVLGTPAAEIDDEVQRTFITVARRLDDVRIGSEKSFLLQTALNVAAHARRTVARRREVPADEAPELVDLATPEQLADRKRARRLLDRVLDEMETDLRTVFVLYEFEELSMAEIAGVLAIPSGTVASRLRRARGQFKERVQALEASTRAKVER
jgi:RNA polymerase sigma-70 factor (ECF subfamily)